MDNKTKILIVEDKTLISLSLKMEIEELGHEVTNTVTCFEDALKSVEENEPDIILMDIDLGENKKDGIETAIAIKELKDIAIIYTTAFSDDITVQRAIATQPHAYLNKPYRDGELKSNILLAKYKIDLNKNQETNPENSYFHLGEGYYFDKENERLYFEDQAITLSLKERKLLKLLFDARGNIVPHIDIEHHIWTEGAVSGSTLRNLVYRLRGKLEHKIIETIPSLGIKLNLPQD